MRRKDRELTDPADRTTILKLDVEQMSGKRRP
jgi:hypothetical protein